MKLGAFRLVECDGCGETEEVELTSTASGYDDRDVDAQLQRLGWKVEGDHDYCPGCQEKEQ